MDDVGTFPDIWFSRRAALRVASLGLVPVPRWTGVRPAAAAAGLNGLPVHPCSSLDAAGIARVHREALARQLRTAVAAKP